VNGLLFIPNNCLPLPLLHPERAHEFGLAKMG